MSSCLTGRNVKGARSRRWASIQSRWRRSFRRTSGASAGAGSSVVRCHRPEIKGTGLIYLTSDIRHGTSVTQREPDQPERADDDAPPGEQPESVALHVVEKSLHHDPGADERHRKAERDDDRIPRRHLAVALVEVIGERAGHRRHREPE